MQIIYDNYTFGRAYNILPYVQELELWAKNLSVDQYVLFESIKIVKDNIVIRLWIRIANLIRIAKINTVLLSCLTEPLLRRARRRAQETLGPAPIPPVGDCIERGLKAVENVDSASESVEGNIADADEDSL